MALNNEQSTTCRRTINYYSLLLNSHFMKLKQLYGSIVWNAHNTAFSSKGSAICAQAVYFLHKPSPSVT